MDIGFREYKGEFNHEPVTANIKPLTRTAFKKLVPLMQQAQDNSEMMEIEQAKIAMNMHDLAEDIFPGHVKDLKVSGTTKDGKAITVQDLIDESIFLELSQDILMALVAISQLKDPEVKNSEGQSENQGETILDRMS